jgi:hypothetical protein
MMMESIISVSRVTTNARNAKEQQQSALHVRRLGRMIKRTISVLARSDFLTRQPRHACRVFIAAMNASMHMNARIA